MRMAREQRSEAQHIVDEVIAVHVDEVSALAARDEERIPAHRPKGAHRAVYPAREERFGARELLLRLRCLHGGVGVARREPRWSGATPATGRRARESGLERVPPTGLEQTRERGDSL